VGFYIGGFREDEGGVDVTEGRGLGLRVPIETIGLPRENVVINHDRYRSYWKRMFVRERIYCELE
jgi:hypothetical protein